MDQYPNMVFIPAISIMQMQTDTIIHFIMINLPNESIFLFKLEVSGFLEQVDTQICEIMTSSALEPLALEVTAQHPKNPLPYREDQFICSPSEFSIPRKVSLQDMEVSENV